MNIAIVGAGIGGLTAALALLRRGFDVTVYEQSSALVEAGAGLQISANVTRVLFSLGLEAPLRAVSTRAGGKEIRLWNTGQSWKLFDLGEVSVEKFGYPYFTLHRADLQHLLAEAVTETKPDCLRLGHRLVDVEDDGETVDLVFADGHRTRHSAVIGADGVHSVVRRRLMLEDDSPVFTGCLAWRGLAATRDLPSIFDRPVACNWVGPGGHIVHYPIRGGALTNFVGVVERDDWREESWTQSGSTGECLDDYPGWHPDIRRLISALQSTMKWALFIRKTLPRWYRGRVALLGDACHATLPFLAQGAGMAIEDGLIVARALEASNDAAAAFERYGEARLGRCRRIVDGSTENAGRFHSPALATEGAAEYVETEWKPGAVSNRYDWIFDYDAVTTPV